MILEPQFDAAWEFREGMAAVMKNGKWGFIDKKGKFLIQPQFEDAAFFSGGLAPVEISGKYGYIDRTGKVVVQPEYDYAYHSSMDWRT